MDQNETLKSEIEALKTSIKSSANKLANINKEIVSAKEETNYERQQNFKLISEYVKFKTDSKQSVQDLKHSIAQLESNSMNNTNNMKRNVLM